MGLTLQDPGTTSAAVPIAQTAQAAITAPAQRGHFATAMPAASETGMARTVSPRIRSSVVRAPKGASHSSLR